MRRPKFSKAEATDTKAVKLPAFSKLGTDNLVKLLFEFSIPSLIAVLAQNLYSIIDGIFVGHGVGELGLAATTVAVPTMMIMTALSILIGAGGNALTAIRLGEERVDEAEHIMATSFLMLIIGAVLVTVFGLIFLEQILFLTGATGEVVPYAKEFVGIVLMGYIFQSVGFGMNNFIRTAGAPNIALASMLIGTIVNTILCWLFVIVWSWGMKGAALATVLAWLSSCIFVMWFFLSGRSSIKLVKEKIGLKLERVKSILALGLAPSILMLGIGALTIVENNLLVYYGAFEPVGADGALAMMGVASRVGMLIAVPGFAFMQGAQPIIGFNYGAKQYRRVRHITYYAMLTAVLMVAVLWVVVLLHPTGISKIFGLSEALAKETAVVLIYWTIFAPLIPVQMIGSNYFEATGQALKATMLTLTRQWLFLIPLLFLCPIFLPQYFAITSVESIFLSASISDITSVFVVGAFFIPEMKKLSRWEQELQAEGIA